MGVSVTDPDANNCLVRAALLGERAYRVRAAPSLWTLPTMRTSASVVWRATGIGTSTTASDTASDTNDVVSMSIDVPEQGILIAGSAFESNGAITTVGVTEDYEDLTGCQFSQQFVAGGSAGPLSQETNRTVSFDGANSADAVGRRSEFCADQPLRP